MDINKFVSVLIWLKMHHRQQIRWKWLSKYISFWVVSGVGSIHKEAICLAIYVKHLSWPSMLRIIGIYNIVQLSRLGRTCFCDIEIHQLFCSLFNLTPSLTLACVFECVNLCVCGGIYIFCKRVLLVLHTYETKIGRVAAKRLNIMIFLFYHCLDLKNSPF